MEKEEGRRGGSQQIAAARPGSLKIKAERAGSQRLQRERAGSGKTQDDDAPAAPKGGSGLFARLGGSGKVKAELPPPKADKALRAEKPVAKPEAPKGGSGLLARLGGSGKLKAEARAPKADKAAEARAAKEEAAEAARGGAARKRGDDIKALLSALSGAASVRTLRPAFPSP
eukprot:366082-Chlamydomonas_euryale.AAC.38